MNNLFNGIYYFFKGFTLIFKPKIRQWVLIPFLINMVLFSLLLYYSWLYFTIVTGFIINFVQTGFPNLIWITNLIGWLIIPLFIGFSLVIILLSFTIIANLIAEPFNGLLAVAVEQYLTNQVPPSSSESIFKKILNFIPEKLGKLLYYLKWFIILLIISILPVINIISPILWFLFMAWIACLEYADAPLGNHHYSPAMQRQLLAQKRLLSLSFGSTTLIALFIPFINFLVMPIAVAGATCMWVHEFKGIKIEDVKIVKD